MEDQLREKLSKLSVEERIAFLIDYITQRKEELGIKYPIKIIAVTKTFDESFIIKAINSGINDIGENRVQEAEKKFLNLTNYSFTKHLLGHLQTNKINKAIKIFDWIDSIDSIELASKLNQKLSLINKKMPVLIEVNTSFEKTKFGVEPEYLEELAGEILSMRNLNLMGLMTIGPLTNDKTKIRKSFNLLYKLREKLKTSFKKEFPHLSMGMSDDFDIAIEEGATLLRLGRIIFGERKAY